jgi:hypothetical protein
MTDTLRQECEALLKELGYGGGEDYWPKEYRNLLAFARAQQAKGLREAAEMLTHEVTEHTKQHGEHQYCDDYGCGFLVTMANDMNAQATARETEKP